MSAVALLLRALTAPASRLAAGLLLVPTLAIAAAYVAIGTQVREIAQNDGAYYFGIARHMALTGRFEEPLVWHFLHPPETLTHAPFDYWGCLTALLLVPSLWLFGATPATAFVTMSLLSAATLLAFWYLVSVALPLRYAATQFLALGLFAFSPLLVEYRFQPESITPAHLAIILALIALARRRYVLAVPCGFAILLSRGDGLILFLLVAAAAFIAAWRERAAAPRRPLAVVAVAGLCGAVYVGWSWASFGTPTPPAPRALPFLTSYWHVFDYGVAQPHGWGELLTRFDWPYVVERLELVRQWAPFLFFTPHPLAWFALVAVPALTLFRGRPFVELVIWAMAVGGFLTVVWVSGPGFYIGRTPAPFTPLVILAGCLGIDAALARGLAWANGRAARGAVVVVAAVAVGVYFLAALPPLGVTPAAARPRWQVPVAQLDPLLGGESVASNLPWYMQAYGGSPVVSIPYNGEAAIEAVLRRYGIRWLVLFGRHQRIAGESQAVLQELIAGRRATIGRLRLERVAAPAPLIAFRIVDPADPASPSTSDGA